MIYKTLFESLVLFLVLSINAPAQDNPEKKDKEEPPPPEQQMMYEATNFNKYILPLLKAKNVSPKTIEEIRQTAPSEAGEKLRAVGIEPNNLEVEPPKTAKKK
jgi:hypothetical protein